ncbi:MAG: DUF4288 domain-containing protein [Anaerolineae bacterium]|nr:DUF4288 domain-containing protein [Anaerolineae bacterium]
MLSKNWFIADLVVEFIIHINVVLIEASSAEEAYAKALEVGSTHEDAYTNPDGNLVEVKFRGLRDLNIIRDELAHGAELTYEHYEGLTQNQMDKFIRPKHELALFRIDDH